METISKDAGLSSGRSDRARTLPGMAPGFALLAGMVAALDERTDTIPAHAKGSHQFRIPLPLVQETIDARD